MCWILICHIQATSRKWCSISISPLSQCKIEYSSLCVHLFGFPPRSRSLLFNLFRLFGTKKKAITTHSYKHAVNLSDSQLNIGCWFGCSNVPCRMKNNGWHFIRSYFSFFSRSALTCIWSQGNAHCAHTRALCELYIESSRCLSVVWLTNGTNSNNGK